MSFVPHIGTSKNVQRTEKYNLADFKEFRSTAFTELEYLDGFFFDEMTNWKVEFIFDSMLFYCFKLFW